MTKFLDITDMQGTEHSINVNHIIYVSNHPSGKETRIALSNSDIITVETYIISVKEQIDNLS